MAAAKIINKHDLLCEPRLLVQIFHKVTFEEGFLCQALVFGESFQVG